MDKQEKVEARSPARLQESGEAGSMGCNSSQSRQILQKKTRKKTAS